MLNGEEMKEVWKDIKIKGYERYEVSDKGNVRNKKTKRLIKPQIDKGGYIRLTLWKGKIKKKQFVHRLVAITFIANQNEQRTKVNHKDGNKLNNAVSNLEWVTPKENLAHSRNVLKQHIKSVKCVETGKVFESIIAASQAYKIEKASISKCCHGKLKTAGSYHWEFVS